MIRLWRLCAGGFGGGVLPCAGGAGDQPAAMMDAFALMSVAETELKAYWNLK